MISPTITVTNPDGSMANFKLAKAVFRESFADAPSKLTLTIAKEHTILLDARISYSVEGTLKLNGQVDDMDESNPEHDILVITSYENQLNDRPMMPYLYPDTCTWAQMLSDQPPTTGGRVGLIYAFNSLFSKGSFALYSGAIYKLAGGGTIRLGVADLYENDYKLVRATTLAGVTAGKYFQDTTDLYVWTRYGTDPQYRLMTSPNWRDTRVRLGTITNGTNTFPVPFKVPADVGWNLIQGILYAMNLEARWRPNKDGYVYLDTAVTIGKGTATQGAAAFVEGENGIDCISLDITSGQRRVNEVVVMGSGSGSSQEGRTVSDLSTTIKDQIWRSAIVSAPSCQGTMLTSVATKILAERRDNRIWLIDGRADYHISPGDYVEIKRKIRGVVGAYYPSEFKRIMLIETTWPENTMKADANRRQLSFSDAFKSQIDLLRTLSSTAQSIATEWSESFKGNVDDAYPLTTTFNLPSGKIDSSFPHKFTIRLSIDAYETDTESTRTASHNNGGVTGNHSNGSKSTNAKTQTAHLVPQQTDAASGASYGVVSGLTGMSWAGSHNHGVGLGGGNAYTSTSGSPAHSHYYYYIYSVSVNWAEGHAHSQSYNQVWCSQNGHTHVMPGHYTNDADAQDHQYDITDSTSPVQTEPEKPTVESIYKKLHDTGSSVHYLDVTVTLNDTQIPGSPFQDLYIGDSIGDVDAGSLVITGDNTVVVSIKDHSNPATPVRCAINGSVSAEYFILNYE